MKRKNIITIKWLTFLCLISGNLLFSQYFQYQRESFLRNYETDYSKGKVDINIPFFSLPTSKGLKINIGMSYNTDAASGNDPGAELGMGWSLSSGGVISKYMYLGLDDNNKVYQYSFLGKNGRFYVKYDNILHDLRAVESYPSKNKIIIEKQSDSVFTGFKIIDENGLKYIFDKKNISYRYEYPQITANPGHPGSNPTAKKELYTSAFYLSRILDENDNILVTYDFFVRTSQIATGKSTVRHRIKKININNIGTIDFTYNITDETFPAQSEDGGQLLSVSAKNKAGQIIDQYRFYYSGLLLDQVEKRDRDNNVVNTRRFLYEYSYPGDISRCYLGSYNQLKSKFDQPYTALLTAMIHPTGGKTEYDYESNVVSSVPTINNNPDADNLFAGHDVDQLLEFDFDVLNSVSNIFTLSNIGDYSRIFISTGHDFHPPSSQPGHPNTSTLFSYRIEKPDNSSYVFPLANYIYDTDKSCANIKEIKQIAGNSFRIRFAGGSSFGNVKVFGVKKLSRDFAYVKGARIKTVKTFEKDSIAPASYIRFEYNQFNNPSKSSATVYTDIPLYASPSAASHLVGEDFNRDQEMILYENVKITDSIKNTSVKYTYMMPDEIDSLYGANLVDFMEFDFNHPLKKMGLVKKIEKYDASGNLVEKNENTNDIEYVNHPGITTTLGNSLNLLFIKSSLNNNEVKVENTSNMLYSTSQTFHESGNNLLTRSLSTDFSGTTTEQKVYYPKDLGNQKLIDANLLSVPLKTEILQNGEFISKSETKFDDPAKVYPTSQVSYHLQTQAPQTTGTIESYDEMGNVRETRSKSGISTVTIWGYHKTQPIAIITGITYAQIQNLAVVSAAVEASNLDHDNPANEPALIQALDELRKSPALVNTQMITYTYDPLIGVTSTTSPSGMREINVYDSANRLMKVLDANGKTLKEVKYNYKNQ